MQQQREHEHATAEPVDPGRSAEEQLLRDALGDELRGELRMLSHEPYGEGALTGFEEAGTARAWYVDTSGKRVDSETGLVLGDPQQPQARIWLHPADPRLPALSPASFPDAAATLMARMGVAIDRRPELLVYRPGKRAMFRMRAGARETYLKIVRPSSSAAIVHLQESLRAGGVPVPTITGWSELGIVLTEAAAGVPLTARLDELDPELLLDSIDALRERMAAVDTGRDARASLASRTPWYVSRLRAALDRHARRGARLGVLLASVERSLDALDAAAPDDADRRTVHGDLHVGQLFIDADGSSRIAGVIDIDTAGLGDPADDEAALMGHLVASIALSRADPARAAGFRRLLDASAARWLAPGRPGRARVAHRTAVHVLAHALTPTERGDLETAEAELALGLEILGHAGRARGGR
ncbi:aminoglycoside phosphotransferase (APT) family kinase protein [Agrococcus sp. UYP10]|uniref:phosphotransferase family protein n=1 Tax=Agrococcus sp. UYP10 TaxID=1756355 RepID=UPI0033979A56